jgi:hypothetical protein
MNKPIKPVRNRFHSSGNVIQSNQSPVYYKNNIYGNHYNQAMHLSPVNYMFHNSNQFYNNPINNNPHLTQHNYNMMQTNLPPQMQPYSFSNNGSPSANRYINTMNNFSYQNSHNIAFSGNNLSKFIQPKKTNSSDVVNSFKMSSSNKNKKSSLFTQGDEEFSSFEELMEKIDCSLHEYINIHKGSR